MYIKGLRGGCMWWENCVWESCPWSCPFISNKPKTQSLKYCANFGWQRVHFLHSGYYGAGIFIIAEQSLHRVQVFSASHPTTPVRGAQGAERRRSQDRTWLTKGIFLSMWCHAQHIKLKGMKGEGGSIQSDAICLPKQSLCVMEPCSPHTHLAMGRGEGIPSFGLLALRAFALAIKLSSFQPPSFPLLPSWISLPSDQGEWAALWSLAASWG